MLECRGQHLFRLVLRRFKRTVLLILSFTLMAESFKAQLHSEQAPSLAVLGIQDQSSKLQSCRNFSTIHSRLLQTSLADDEANFSREITSRKVVETGLLGEDGSMPGADFLVPDEFDDIVELFPSEVETTIAKSNARFVPQEKVKDVIPCKESMQDLLPHRQKERGTGSCVVVVPSRYVRQYKWPLSQFKSRVQNVPHSPLLKSRRSRAWVHVNASTIFFLSGGPTYPHGVEAYLDHLIQLVPDLGIGTTTRVALDFECGTGSLSRVLGQRGVATLCLASYDSLEDGIQLVMERGFPGLLTHSLSSRIRFPYPSQAFDLLHCAACNISWASNEGTLLFEADRILRRGGFFAWIMDMSNQGISWSDMAIQADKLCWKLMIRDHQLAVWQKTTNMTSVSCSYDTHVPLCNFSAPLSNATWKVVMRPCLESTGDDMSMVDVNWTSRLIKPSKRLEIIPAAGLQRAKEQVLASDFNYWVYLTDIYVRTFGSSRVADIRNVLDINAGYGSFAAALAMRTPPVPWWVLNVVPVDQPDRLSVVFDRGLLGLYHDWCEPLDSYARTFDFIHASRFFAFQHRCSAQVILQEIDRLLRPGGFVIFRDHKAALLPLQKIAKVLHWKAHFGDTDSGTWGTDKLLHCQKTRWTNSSKPK
ncbi:hypothetical protein KC19_3G006600 [Ceratodon purpureus]|uniref:Methyltransferase n=1 Tax=Ceratodon purpureus TaxID=3225 RepID=A0A8T0IFT1_CERPU|nr:hypothetical protein KC19_3G006600 [Ceratodon purpureus]